MIANTTLATLIKGRADALEALRVARGRGQATTISASGAAPAPFS
jgi:hypothetical protein